MEPVTTRRSTLVLLILAFLMVSILPTLWLIFKQQEIRKRAAAETTLTLQPEILTVYEGQEFELEVVLNTGDHQVSAVDLTLNYNPAILEGVSLVKGTFLPNRLGQVIVSGGRARIALGSSTNSFAQGTGIVAVLKLRALSQTSSPTEVTFDTLATQARDPNQPIGTNIIDRTQGAQITVNIGSPPSPEPSPEVSPLPSPPASTSPLPSGIGGPPASPQSSPSDPCQNNTPALPTNLTTQTVSTNQIRLTWEPKTNVTHYGIVYGPRSRGYTWGAANVGNVSSYTVGGLSAGTTYYFAVFAVNDCGSSGYSNEASARTNSTGFAATPRPEEVLSDEQFVPIDPGLSEEEIIPFLSGKPISSPVDLPTVSVPPTLETAAGRKNPLLSPLGGILLLIVGIFLTIFFFRMRSH